MWQFTAYVLVTWLFVTCRFEPNTDITGMVSVEGELIPLKTRIKPSQANGAVEKWLVQVG